MEEAVPVDPPDPGHVLQHRVLDAELAREARDVPEELVLRIVRTPRSRGRVALARRPGEEDVDVARPRHVAPERGSARLVGNLRLDHGHAGIVQPVRLGGVPLGLDRKSDAIPLAPKSRSQAARAGEEVHGDRRAVRLRNRVATPAAERDQDALPAALVLRAADLAPVVHEVDVKALPPCCRHRLLKRVVIRLPTCGRHDANAPENSVDVCVDRELVAVQGVRQDAPRALRTDAREPYEKRLRLAVVELVEKVQCEVTPGFPPRPDLPLAIRVRDSSEELLELPRLASLESSRPHQSFQAPQRGSGGVGPTRVPAAKDLVDLPVHRLPRLLAEEDEYDLVQRIVQVEQIGRPVPRLQELVDALDEARPIDCRFDHAGVIAGPPRPWDEVLKSLPLPRTLPVAARAPPATACPARNRRFRAAIRHPLCVCISARCTRNSNLLPLSCTAVPMAGRRCRYGHGSCSMLVPVPPAFSAAVRGSSSRSRSRRAPLLRSSPQPEPLLPPSGRTRPRVTLPSTSTTSPLRPRERRSTITARTRSSRAASQGSRSIQSTAPRAC